MSVQLKRTKHAGLLIHMWYGLALIGVLSLVGCDVVPFPTGPAGAAGNDTILPTPTALPALTPLSTSTPTEQASPTPRPTVTLTLVPTSPTLPAPPTPSPTPSPSATHTVVVEMPTETPKPEPTPTPTDTSPLPQSPQAQAWEGTITVNTYGWEAALVDTQPGDVIYPYPRLEQHLVRPPQPREYRTIVLENEYLRLTLLPELGGRIYRWLDKLSGQEMFYVNPVIKPTRWGARGWWLATGGMEWAFPVEEHGLVEWRLWSYEIARTPHNVSVTLSNTDDRTGLVVQVTVVVNADRSGYTVHPRIYNPTDADQSYQFWLNGMFALSPTNHPGPDLQFALPVDSVIVHSTGDRRLPEPGHDMNWPIYDGIDLSRYGNWESWLGIFAPQADYVGAYDPISEMGVVRVFPRAVAQGAKIFGPGTLSPDLWTDDASGYVELWGGLTPTFWDYATLAPGESVAWQERWYGLIGLGGLSYANDDAALWLARDDGRIHIGVITTRPITGQLILRRDSKTVTTWDVALTPTSPFRATHSVGGGTIWYLELLDVEGRSIATYQTDTL